MVTTQQGRVDGVVDCLLQLAMFVDQTATTPREVAERLLSTLSADGPVDRGQWSDLLELCQSESTAAEFAKGLRRQATSLRAAFAE